MKTNVGVVAMGAMIALLVLSGGTASAGDARIGDLYSLDTCAVSGKALDAKGSPTVNLIDGREVRTCCSGCAKKLKGDGAAAILEKLDAKLIADQKALYPLETCVVSGKALEKDSLVAFVAGNRLVKTCCSKCAAKVAKAPAKFIAKLDEAAIKAQDKNYPLDTCVVAGGKLGKMGEPYSLVVAGRLIKLCCDGCASKIQKNPASYLSKIDMALGHAAGKVKVSAEGSGAKTASSSLANQACAGCAVAKDGVCEKCAAAKLAKNAK